MLVCCLLFNSRYTMPTLIIIVRQGATPMKWCTAMIRLGLVRRSMLRGLPQNRDRKGQIPNLSFQTAWTLFLWTLAKAKSFRTILWRSWISKWKTSFSDRIQDLSRFLELIQWTTSLWIIKSLSLQAAFLKVLLATWAWSHKKDQIVTRTALLVTLGQTLSARRVLAN